jgi:spore germination protein GerM
VKRAVKLLLIAAVLLGLCACSAKQEQRSAYVLYFPVSRDVQHGPALETQPIVREKDAPPPTPEALIQALLAGPTQEGLMTPFPKGTVLLSLAREGGAFSIRLSEPYSGLTDISLTLADYAIVLTLAQLEGVETVEIRSAEMAATYRSHQLLRPEEAVLTDNS